MRKPTTLECLYLDFDSFFAAVEEQARPALRGKPIGVTPFAHTTSTCIIAANRRAKLKGVKTGMGVVEARKLCPDLQLVPQSPDLYERAHRKLLLVIEREIPIDAVCSIDELSCKLDARDIVNPAALSARIKARILQEVGPYITCSIGMAPNRHLAKIASDMDKPNGLTILNPTDLPGRLLELALNDIPGIGKRMKQRLIDAGIWSVEALWNTEPKQLRALWGTVTGERFWYALHGYEIQADPSQRAMFGHGRVLPPEWRDLGHAFEAARALTIKAARRLRRADYNARKFGLWLKAKDDRWSAEHYIGEVNDDRSALRALTILWQQAAKALPASIKITQVHIALYDLRTTGNRQSDMFDVEGPCPQKRNNISAAIDKMNQKYAKTMISVGAWPEIPGGYAGGKISFSRVPDMEDFW